MSELQVKKIVTVNYSEFRDMFKLADHNRNTIKPALKNKIHFVTEEQVIVTDESFANLVEEFKNGGSMDWDELKNEYNLTDADIYYLMRNEMITYFKLQPNKRGTKILFLRSEMEQSLRDVILTEVKAKSNLTKGVTKNITDLLAKRFLEVFVALNYLSEKDCELFKLYYLDKIPGTEIALRFGYSRQYVYLKLPSIEKKIVRIFVSLLHDKGNDYKSKFFKLQNEFRVVVEELNKLKGEYSPEEYQYAINCETPINLLDTSIRLQNCLSKINIKLLKDLKGRKRSYFLKMRNFGYSTLCELDSLMAKYNIEYAHEDIEAVPGNNFKKQYLGKSNHQ